MKIGEKQDMKILRTTWKTKQALAAKPYRHSTKYNTLIDIEMQWKLSNKILNRHVGIEHGRLQSTYTDTI